MTLDRTEYDVVYLDPPYYKSFTDYTRWGFERPQQEELAEVVRGLPCTWVLSNSPAAAIFYEGLPQEAYNMKRAMDAGLSPDGTANELLVWSA